MTGITSQISGRVLEAKTATFTDDSGQEQTYGKIQILTTDMSGEFYSITNIKVRKEDFGYIPTIQGYKNKTITIPLDQTQYQGKISYYLAAQQFSQTDYYKKAG